MSSEKMAKVAKLGTARARPGQTAKGSLSLLRRADGSAFEIPTVIINGMKPGPVLWLDGAIHGDEPAGAHAIGKLVRSIKPEQLAGVLIAVPVLNTSAFGARSRISPVDHKDLNRIFPGKEDGSYSDRAAFELLRIIEHHADYYIGLHGSGNDGICIPYTVYRSDGKAGSMSEEMAKASGIRFSYKGTGDLGGALYSQLAGKGVPSLLIEAGGEGKIRPQDVDAHTQAIVNVMRFLKMLKGTYPRLSKFVVVENSTTVTVANGGFLIVEVSPGSEVAKGEVLARVVDVYGAEIQTLRSPRAGLLYSTTTRGTVDPGDRVCSVLY